ncbi:MAG TPA: sensor domain-containing diguanylate cyclase [Acidimicrobiales bacterium]|nr:sensor domain-containing diguanylate cyclase [Acidimicrobiales bacterium]
MAFGRKKSEETSTASETRDDVSGIMTRAVIRFVRKFGGDDAVSALIAQSGESRSISQLEDVTSWSSYDECCAMLDAAVSVTGDQQIGRKIGEYIITDYDTTEVTDLLRALGSPAECFRNMARASAKFTTVGPMDALEVGDGHAVIKCECRPEYKRHPQDCEMTKGLISQVPVLFDLVPATITESECQAKGGRYCMYSVAWEQGQWSSFVDGGTSLYAMAWDEQGVVEAQSELEIDDATRVSQLERQLSAIQERLEGVYGIAADLLSDDDINAVLSRIATKAAYAVNAPRYILAVRPTDDEDDVRTHYRGFEFDEAQEIAAGLLDGRSADSGGSMLVADIQSSRRHYGKIAAVYPAGNEFFEQEQGILTVYADYAATALDVVTALDEARRSDSTSRALLAFAGGLAKVGSSGEVAEQLVEAVPAVMSCDRASVFLWDEEEEAFVLRATYTVSDQLVGPDGRADGHLTPADKLPDLKASPSDSPYVKRLMESPDVLIVDRNDSDPYALALLAGAEAATSVLAPLMAPDGTIGIVVALYQREIGSQLRTDKHMRGLIEGLSNQAIVALLNARMVDQIREMALHDALTGLPNRRLLQDRVDQAIARSDRTGELLSLFFVDLDHFKQVNDTMGHAAGDELIRQVAERLLGATRKQDTVARLGGDEFCILGPGMTEPPAISEMADRLLEVLSTPFDLGGGQTANVSGSIGVSVAPRNGRTYDELVSCADSAMYLSKESGRNTYNVFEVDKAAQSQ